VTSPVPAPSATYPSRYTSTRRSSSSDSSSTMNPPSGCRHARPYPGSSTGPDATSSSQLSDPPDLVLRRRALGPRRGCRLGHARRPPRIRTPRRPEPVAVPGEGVRGHGVRVGDVDQFTATVAVVDGQQHAGPGVHRDPARRRRRLQMLRRQAGDPQAVTPGTDSLLDRSGGKHLVQLPQQAPGERSQVADMVTARYSVASSGSPSVMTTARSPSSTSRGVPSVSVMRIRSPSRMIRYSPGRRSSSARRSSPAIQPNCEPSGSPHRRSVAVTGTEAP
jgi:hypothetical protein